MNVYSKPRSKQRTNLYRFISPFFLYLFMSLSPHSALLYSVVQIVVCRPMRIATSSFSCHLHHTHTYSTYSDPFVCESLIVVNINFRLKISRMFAMLDFNSGQYTTIYECTWYISHSLYLPPPLSYFHFLPFPLVLSNPTVCKSISALIV